MAHKPAARIAFSEILSEQYVIPGGISSEEAFGIPEAGTQTLSISGILSEEAFGSPLLLQSIFPSGIASAEAFGIPFLSLFVWPEGIGSAEAFGVPGIGFGINPPGIPTGENFGMPSLSHVLLPAGIASSETFGTPGLIYDQTLALTGIPSAEYWGTPRVKRLNKYLLPARKQATPQGISLGMKKMPEVASFSTGMKSLFGMKPLIKKVAQDAIVPDYIIEGPLLDQAEELWLEFGLVIRAEADITLLSVRFPNQGLADEIKLCLNSDYSRLTIIPVPAGNEDITVNINYPLDAGVTYILIANTMNNKYWGEMGAFTFPVTNPQLTVLGSYGEGYTYTDIWFAFNDIATKAR